MSKINTTYHSEKDIIKGCLKNERLAQQALYENFKTRMYTLAYRITGNFDGASDVLQEGFLSVFRNLDSFKGESKLSSWIHTIIARLAIRKIKDRIYFEDIDTADTSVIIDWGVSIDIDHLEKAIAELPDGYRSIFTLYEIEGFKHGEIALLLDVSENTSKSQLFKAKKMLLDKLNNFVGPIVGTGIQRLISDHLYLDLNIGLAYGIQYSYDGYTRKTSNAAKGFLDLGFGIWNWIQVLK